MASASEPVELMESAVLQRLIAPYTVEEFISQFWEQTYLHVSREDNPLLGCYFDELISVDDIDALLATLCDAGPQRWDAIRMSQNGTPVSPTEFQSNVGAGTASFRFDRILSLYRQGATVIVNGVQQTLGPVATLCNELSCFFGVRVLANVYITPPSRQGFPAHHDDHDVFLLQILGEKNWKLYGSPVPLSRWADRADAANPCTEAQDELRLQAGEVLYIPRGLVHEGKASSATSFHVTVGVHPYTWAQLLKEAVSELEREDLEFRRSVAPQLAAVTESASLEATVALLSERVRDSRRLARIARQTAADTRSGSRVPARGRFRNLVDPPSITLTTMLHMAHGEDIRLDGTEDEVVLTSREKVIALPAHVLPQVQALFSGRPTCAAALPPGLDEAGRLVLVQRLTSEGLLEPHQAGSDLT